MEHTPAPRGSATRGELREKCCARAMLRFESAARRAILCFVLQLVKVEWSVFRKTVFMDNNLYRVE